MDVFLPENPNQIDQKLTKYLAKQDIRSFRSLESVRREAKLFHEELFSRFQTSEKLQGPIILTGHQPTFYTPGILIKDLLANTLAQRYKGIAMNLIVDTDQSEISFDFPSKLQSLRNEKKTVIKLKTPINKVGKMLKFQEIDHERKKILIRQIQKCNIEIAEIFSETMTQQIREELEILAGIVDKASKVSDPGVHFRENWEKRRGLNIKTIYASEMIKTNAFDVFKQIIFENGSEFRKQYNLSLNNYRIKHKIKNKAQPIPDLRDEIRELPFWIIENGKRIPFSEDAINTTHEVYPRAITLTLFCRLFLCDLFIHGRGGARYDLITNRILKTFFHGMGAPFTIASATLSLEPKPGYVLHSRPRREIDQDIRALQFDPTRYLKNEHPLRIEKEKAIAKLINSKTEKKTIHELLMEINAKTGKLLDNTSDNLYKEKINAAVAEQNRRVFLDRSFPFIFYDLSPLFAAVRSYG